MSAYDEYLEDLKYLATADDSVFPDFLFALEANEFEDDNYYARGIAESPLLQEAKQIRRKYSDFFDFQDALDSYRTYMELLMDKYDYPSIKAVSHAAKNGMIEDYVPPKPRLKNTRKNRALASAGMIPSRQVLKPLTGDDLVEVARMINPEADGSHTKDEDIKTKPTKAIKEIFDDASSRVAGINRRRNMYRKKNTNAEIDFVMNYMRELNKGNLGYRYDDGTVDTRPLSDIVKELQEEAMIPEELRDCYTPNTTTIRNGRMVKAQQDADNEIAKILWEAGLDVFGTYKNHMSREAIKMVRNAVGGPLTKKEKKKMKKLHKEEQKRLATSRNNDAMIERVLTRNRFIDREDGSTISFTMSDLIGR